MNIRALYIMFGGITLAVLAVLWLPILIFLAVIKGVLTS